MTARPRQLDEQPPPPRALRWLGVAAVAAAGAFALSLGVRPIASYDIGYHLAYGEHFLDHGEIVTTNRWVYTRLRNDILADPGQIGPGCRYDPATGTYHFVNVNWLNQVMMAAVHRAGGMGGLWALQAGLVAGIFALIVVTMRRGGVGWHWAALAVMLVGLTAYERFNLRPEAPGYVLLLAQWLLLCREDFGPRRAAAVVAIQAVSANSHAYFLLGIALAGAMLAGALLTWLWRVVARRLFTHPSPVKGEGFETASRTGPGELVGSLKWRALATAGMIAVCFCNPWFARGAIMPVETAAFLKAGEFIGRTGETPEFLHWATIGEFVHPFIKGLEATLATWGFKITLAVAGAGMVAALLRRRAGWVLAGAGMTVLSLQMRRNIAFGAMVLVPLSAMALTDGWGWLRERLGGRLGERVRRAARAAAPAVAAAGIALGVFWTACVVTQRFYAFGGHNWRFGWGLSRVTLPVEPAEWIDTHLPAGPAGAGGRVFAGMGSSSNLMYLTRPHRDMPILTNTWAYPPYLLGWALQCTSGQRQFQPVVDEYDIEVVVLQSFSDTGPLIGLLSRSEKWLVVDLGADHVVFLRADRLARARGNPPVLTEPAFDLPAYTRRVLASDPVAYLALRWAAMLLKRMEWGGPEIDLWRESLRANPRDLEAVRSLGMALAMRGSARAGLWGAHLGQQSDQQARRAADAARADWLEAAGLFRRFLERRPDNEEVALSLRQVQAQMADLSRGMVQVAPGSYVYLTGPESLLLGTYLAAAGTEHSAQARLLLAGARPREALPLTEAAVAECSEAALLLERAVKMLPGQAPAQAASARPPLAAVRGQIQHLQDAILAALQSLPPGDPRRTDLERLELQIRKLKLNWPLICQP